MGRRSQAARLSEPPSSIGARAAPRPGHTSLGRLLLRCAAVPILHSVHKPFAGEHLLEVLANVAFKCLPSEPMRAAQLPSIPSVVSSSASPPSYPAARPTLDAAAVCLQAALAESGGQCRTGRSGASGTIPPRRTIFVSHDVRSRCRVGSRSRCQRNGAVLRETSKLIAAASPCSSSAERRWFRTARCRTQRRSVWQIRSLIGRARKPRRTPSFVNGDAEGVDVSSDRRHRAGGVALWRTRCFSRRRWRTADGRCTYAASTHCSRRRCCPPPTTEDSHSGLRMGTRLHSLPITS